MLQLQRALLLNRQPTATERDSQLLWLAGIAAGALAIQPLLKLLATMRHFVAGEIGLAALVAQAPSEFAFGPLMVYCTMIFVRAARRGYVISSVRLWSIVGFAGAGFALLPHHLWSLSSWPHPNDAAFWFLWVMRLIGDVAAACGLLLPQILLRIEAFGVWQRRLAMFAAIAAAAVGLGGIAILVGDGSSIQSIVGGTLGRGIQTALTRPAPILGLWPLAGLAAAIGLWAAMKSSPSDESTTNSEASLASQRTLIRVATSVAIFFLIGRTVRMFDPAFIAGSTLTQIIEQLSWKFRPIGETIATGVVFVLLLWSTFWKTTDEAGVDIATGSAAELRDS